MVKNQKRDQEGEGDLLNLNNLKSMNIINKILSYFMPEINNFLKRDTGFDTTKQDKRDYAFAGPIFGYTPKHNFKDNAQDWQKVRDQKRQNTCVLEAIANQKEVDEGVELGTRDMAAYLKSKHQMSSRGTSLSNAQNALRKRGIAEKKMIEHNYDVPWNTFANSKILTNEVNANASEHKSKSSWKTYSVDKVVQEIDNGRTVHTGADWMSGWNNINAPFIIKPGQGYVQFGHAFWITGYDLNYNGKKVFRCWNSWNTKYGDGGKFYVEFSDFRKVCKYGAYFNEDVPKNVYGWLITHLNRVVKELNGPKVYFVDGNRKRWVPDEAMLFMLGFNWNDVVIDRENYLKDVTDAGEITFEEIPEDKKRSWEQAIKEMQKSKVATETQEASRFGKYFPHLFN